MPGVNFRAAEGKRNGIVSVMGMEFPSVRADLDFDGQVLSNVSVRYKGNGTFLQSRSSLKRSLKVDLNEGFPGRKLHGVSKLNFHCNVTDASWMNEVLAYRLFRDAGVPASRTAYAKVYVTVPGKYDHEFLGLYSLVENIDNNFAKDRFGTKKGAIFKPVAQKMFEDMGDDWKAYQQAYDPKTPVSDEETRRVIAFCQLVSHADDAKFAQELEAYLDVEEFARFMAVTVWLSTMDSLLAMGQNYVVYLHPTTHQFQFIPWDLDHSFGQFYPIGTQEQRETLSIHKPWAGANRFLERVFQVDAFKQRYLAHLKEFDRTICRPARIAGQVDELATVLRPIVQAESAEKLARFDQVVAGRAGGTGRFRRWFWRWLRRSATSGGPSPQARPTGAPARIRIRWRSSRSTAGRSTTAGSTIRRAESVRVAGQTDQGVRRRAGPDRCRDQLAGHADGAQLERVRIVRSGSWGSPWARLDRTVRVLPAALDRELFGLRCSWPNSIRTRVRRSRARSSTVVSRSGSPRGNRTRPQR